MGYQIMWLPYGPLDIKEGVISNLMDFRIAQLRFCLTLMYGNGNRSNLFHAGLILLEEKDMFWKLGLNIR